MMRTQCARISLELPQSLKEAAARLAREDGVSLDQWIVPAVAQKIGPMETADDFLKARAGKAKRGDLTRLLDRAPDVPPMPEDAIKD
ncbi:MAG: pilus assembly protein HicB [bacterium]|nr:pilus assembly protein HicB [bacterium]